MINAGDIFLTRLSISIQLSVLKEGSGLGYSCLNFRGYGPQARASTPQSYRASALGPWLQVSGLGAGIQGQSLRAKASGPKPNGLRAKVSELGGSDPGHLGQGIRASTLGPRPCGNIDGHMLCMNGYTDEQITACILQDTVFLDCCPLSLF